MPDFTGRLTPEEREMYDNIAGQVEALRSRVDVVEADYVDRIGRIHGDIINHNTRVMTLNDTIHAQNDTVNLWNSEMDRLKQYIVNDLPEVITDWVSRYFDPSITEESTKEMRDSLRELLSSGFPS